MKPVIILPPDTMSQEDIEQLRANDICVVVASDPDAVRFVEPPPTGDAFQTAAVKVCRIVAGENRTHQLDYGWLHTQLLRNMLPDPNPPAPVKKTRK